MKFKFLALAALFCCSASLGWQEYFSEKGKFVVLAPAGLSEKVTTLKTGIGEIEYHTFVCQPAPDDLAAENLLYLVSYCDYPAGTVHADSADLLQSFFEASIDESARSVRGQLVYAADFRWADFPGKTWRVDYNNATATIRTKAFVVRNRVYTLQTACRREQSLNHSADRFFDSFKLLP